jgi:hypothetical protein
MRSPGRGVFFTSIRRRKEEGNQNAKIKKQNAKIKILKETGLVPPIFKSSNSQIFKFSNPSAHIRCTRDIYQAGW